MPDADTIHILGEGGSIIELALPLHETITDKLARGHIRRVNPDGTEWTGEPDPDVPAVPTAPPAASAAKSYWVGWAVACGASVEDAEAMTKADLVERYANAAPASTEQQPEQPPAE